MYSSTTYIVLTALNIKIASLIDIEVVVRRKNAFVFMLPDPSMGMEIDYISLVFIFSIILIYRFYFVISEAMQVISNKQGTIYCSQTPHS